MKIKISSSFSGVISTGSYENSRPGFTAEIEFDSIPDTDPMILINERQKMLQEICQNNFKACEQQAIVDRITKERQDIRFYPCPKCSHQHPSCSSIIGWDADFFIPPHELQQYASQGNLYHLQGQHFIETGKWESVEKIEGSWTDLVILKQGNLKLTVGGWDFPAFLVKHPLKDMENGKHVISCKHKFGGTPDIRKCLYNDKKTLADFKRTPDKLKNFKQMAGYVICEEENGESPYEQMMIIPANDNTAQGFSKPIVTTEISQYKQMFLKDREAFQKRFGL